MSLGNFFDKWKEAVKERQRAMYLPGIEERKAARKSLWHLFKIILLFALWGYFSYYFFQAIWQLHIFWHPDHAGRFNEFWGEGISFGSFVYSFMMMIPLVFPTAIAAMTVTNSILYAIPPARNAFEAEAKKCKDLSFVNSIKGLWGPRILGACAICLGLSVLGAWLLKSLQ